MGYWNQKLSNGWESQVSQLGLDPLMLHSIREQGRRQTVLDTPDAEYYHDYGCHYIAPEVAGHTGLMHESGIVLDPSAPEGYFDHHWNVHPSGSIVDVTHQQVIAPDDPRHRSYISYGELGKEADPLENPQGFARWLSFR